MDIRLLGPLDVWDHGRSLPLGAPRRRAVIAAIALRAGRTVSIDRLVADLWGESVPSSAVKMIQIAVSHLRKVLPEGALATRPSGYELVVAPDAVDAVRFERAIAVAREAMSGGAPDLAATVLDEALGLWRGPALAGMDEPFALSEARRLEEARLRALEERVEADLLRGHDGDAIAGLERLVGEHPLRERPRTQLMLALYRAGRQADALAVARETRRLLDEGLGVEVSVELRDMERRILRHDPALRAPPRPTDQPPGASAPAAGPLVGRDLALEQLGELLDAAGRGSGAVVAVTGEAGAGKSTLIDALLARARADGRVRVGRGRCAERHGAGEPYMAVLEALECLCAAPGGEDLVDLIASRAPTWLLQMPARVAPQRADELRERTQGVTPERMLREIRDLLADLAADRPLVVAIEDVHWADRSSAELLVDLARRPVGGGLMLLVSLRSGDAATRAHPVRADLAEMIARGAVARLECDPLDDAQVEQYLRARDPRLAAIEELAGTLRERTGGNPLFVEKVVDEWVERAERDPGHRGADHLIASMPASVRQLIRSRIAAVDDDERRLLEAAGVAAPEFSAALVGAACGLDDDLAEHRCHSLARDGVLLVHRGAEMWPDGTIADRFGFSHDLCHEVIYEDLPAGRRARLHQAIGDRLELAFGSRTDEVAARLGVHFSRAGDTVRAVGHLRRAAARALERLAPREAAELARAGLDLLDSAPFEVDERDRAELHLFCTLGPAALATEGWASADAERAFAGAVELASRLGDEDAWDWSTFRLASLFEVRGEYRRAETLVEGALRAREGGPGAAGLADSHELLACSLFHQGAFARSYESARRGLIACSAASAPLVAYADDPAVTCRSWAALSSWFLGHPDRAMRLAIEAVEVARGSPQRLGLSIALGQAAMVAQCRRDPVSTARWALEGITAAEEEGYLYRVAMARTLHGWAAARTGALAEGVREMREGIALCDGTGALMDRAYHLALVADALLEAEQPGAEEALAEAAASVPRGGRFFWEPEIARLRAVVAMRRGDPAAAERELDHALAVARDRESRGLELRIALTLARLHDGHARPGGARELLSGVVGAFDEGADTPDLREARAVLSV